MEYKITVVGIGPGSPDYLLPIAKQAIENAQVLVGSKRALETFASGDVTTKVIGKDITDVMDFIQHKLNTQDVVVMVSGDPGFYSLLGALQSNFSSSQLSVIPGISSVQLAFARIGQLWHDANLISMHGREPSADCLKYEPNKKLGILTDFTYNPQNISHTLIAHGWPANSQVWLCENLSYDNERIVASTLEETKVLEGFCHCVMVVNS